MESSSRAAELIWIGPAVGGLSWLHDMTMRFCRGDAHTKRQMRCMEQVSGFDELSRQAGHGTQRVILACHNRWDYPLQELSEFTAEFPDVPVGVAVSDWWLGWRRTGIGHLDPLPHVCLPWFRWWDGWFDWLAGDAPSMFGPFPSIIPFSTGHAADCVATQPEVSSRQILLVGDCQVTMQGWQQLLGRKFGTEMYAARMESDDSWKRLVSPGKPLWILWDDSRLPTVRGVEACIDLAIQELSELAMQFPHARLWVAWSAPVWSDIQRLSESGLHFELLAKPFFGNFSSAALDRI